MFLEIFYQKIGLSIKRKKIKLEEALNSFKREAFDGDKTRKDIINSLEKNSKTIKEISKEINKHCNTVRYHLKNLENIKVYRIGKRLNKCNVSYLWSLI